MKELIYSLDENLRLVKKGEIIRKIPEEDLLGALKAELDNWGKA